MSLRNALVGVVVLATSACAGGQVAPAGPTGASSGEWTTLQVSNDTPNTMRIYVVWNGDQIPVGRVDALGESQLRVPGIVAGTIQLMAAPTVTMAGNRHHLSEPIHLHSGHRIAWRLQTSPGISDVPRFSSIRLIACRGESGC